MRNVSKFILFVFAITMCVSNNLFADTPQKKKAKKEYVWEMPDKLSGNDIIDSYLLSCDTLWNQIQNYNNQITYYKVAQAPTGEVDDTGKPIYNYMVIDDEGNPYNTWAVIGQYAEWIGAGTLIVLQGATVIMQNASATLELPNLGLGALTYAKYLKGGLQIGKKGAEEIKKMNDSAKIQGAAIKALKQVSINTAENKDAVMKTSDIPEGVEIVQKTQEEFDEIAANYAAVENYEELEIDESIFD
ncbi:hypothetical protein LJC39_00180 [Parabacteroides sp. OttesenSCG-928-B22]|nr:hypothetical protein [Parabacteroides sp. OttesenSCG-928-B22]